MTIPPHIGAAGDDGRATPPATECIDDAVMAALVDGHADEGLRRDSIAHLANCARCREVLSSTVHALNDDAVRLAVTAAEPRRWTAHVWKLASMGAAAAIVLLLWPGDDADVGSNAQHRAPEITSGSIPVGRAPVGVVSRVNGLRWHAVEGADRYRVRVFDTEGQSLFETEVNDTLVILPDTVVLQAGARYFWAVDARTGFNRWTPSGLIEFSIARRTP